MTHLYMCKGDYSVLHFWFKLVNNLIVIRCKNAKMLKNPNQKHALKLVSRSYLDILLLERYLALNFCIQVYHVSLDKNRWVRVMMLQYICRQTVLNFILFYFFYTQLPVMSFERKQKEIPALLTFSLNDYFIWK